MVFYIPPKQYDAWKVIGMDMRNFKKSRSIPLGIIGHRTSLVVLDEPAGAELGTLPRLDQLKSTEYDT